MNYNLSKVYENGKKETEWKITSYLGHTPSLIMKAFPEHETEIYFDSPACWTEKYKEIAFFLSTLLFWEENDLHPYSVIKD